MCWRFLLHCGSSTTIILRHQALKWIIQDDLPRVPYLTLLDTFLLVSGTGSVNIAGSI